MAALDFPASPTLNQQYSANGSTWTWNGVSWIANNGGISGFSGYSGFSGISGFSGASGISGFSGRSGFSGTNGTNGASGISGFSGFSGISGFSGFSGFSGSMVYPGAGIPLSTGTAWSTSFNNTSNPITVPYGGTGLTSLTAGYIPFGAGASSLGNSANLFWDSVNTRLGVGTNTPGFNLDVVAAGNSTARIYNSASTAAAYLSTQNSTGSGLFGVDATGVFMFTNSAIPLLFSSGGGEKMRIATSGNMALGTTLASWSSTYRVFEFGSSGALFSTSAGNNANAFLSANFVTNSSGVPLYKTSAPATYYAQSNGTHAWYTAPSGTAGNGIGFTERFQIGASGQIGIGGAIYGTSGQALVSNGASSAPSWQTVSGGQYFGTAAVKAIAYNSATIAENITVTNGNNGLSAGPITINSGFTVTVESGATWTIV